MIRDRFITAGDPNAETVLLEIGGAEEKDGLKQQWEMIAKASQKDVFMILFPVADWNKELSPWAAPPAFGKEPFSGEAAVTLQRVQSEVLSHLQTKTVLLGGYSLAGLFALWAAYETDSFSGVNAASPSVWFPGWIDYIGKRRIRTGKVALSLGDREEKTKNPVLSTVGDCIQKQQEQLLKEGIPVRFEWNKGNHFQNASERTAKGFIQLLSMQEQGKEG